MYSTLNRKLKEGKTIENELKSLVKKSDPPKPKTPKQPASKRARMDFEVSEEDRRKFEEEFRDFDFSEDLDDEKETLQGEELEKLDIEDEKDQIKEFISNVEKMKPNVKDEGHPKIVSLVKD